MQNSIISRVLTISVALLITFSLTNCQQLQSLSFWTAQGCPGNPQITASATSNHNISTNGSSLYYKPNGLWAIEVCNANSSNICNLRRIAQGTNLTTVGCILLSNPGYNLTTLRLTRFGNDRQDEASITFFPQSEFQGVPVVVNSPGRNITVLARSYFFTGVNRWEHRVNHTSSGTCLYSTPAVTERGYGHTTQLNSNIEIGTVLHNCPTVPTTTRPSTGPTTRPPTGSTVRTTPFPGNATTTSGGRGTNTANFMAVVFTLLSSFTFTNK